MKVIEEWNTISNHSINLVKSMPDRLSNYNVVDSSTKFNKVLKPAHSCPHSVVNVTLK